MGVGSQMTSNVLRDFMRVRRENGTFEYRRRAEHYAEWLGPFQSTLREFAISTPKRVAAFLAQVNQESRLA